MLHVQVAVQMPSQVPMESSSWNGKFNLEWKVQLGIGSSSVKRTCLHIYKSICR